MKYLATALLFALTSCTLATVPPSRTPAPATVTRTSTARPTASATASSTRPASTVAVTVTIRATLTDTPEPGGFRLPGYQPPVYEVANVIETVCHNRYFFWEVDPHGMTWREDALAEKLCVMGGVL